MPVKELAFFLTGSESEQRTRLQELRRTEPQEYESDIVTYLRSGELIAVMPGIDEDVLSQPARRIPNEGIRCDGVWVWIDSLSYYVETYHIALPEEFLAHLRSKSFDANRNQPWDGTMPANQWRMA